MFWNPPSSRGLSLFCFEKLIKTKISHSSNKSKDCGSCPFTSYFRLILVMYRVALFRAQHSGDFSQGLFIIWDQGGHKALDCYKFNFIFERIKNVEGEELFGQLKTLSLWPSLCDKTSDISRWNYSHLLLHVIVRICQEYCQTKPECCPNAECGKYLRLLLKNFWGRWKGANMMFLYFWLICRLFFEIIFHGEHILRLQQNN